MPIQKQFKTRGRLPNKYVLYEASVQSPEHDTAWIAEVYRQLRNREPRSLREDFCGTYSFAVEWVKRGKGYRALGLDLDPEPLEHGTKYHRSRLKPAERRRLKILRQNVLSVTRPGVDILVAFNFSFFVLKTRDELVRYLKFVRRSLAKDGIVIFEMAGGPGMIEKGKETRGIKNNGRKWFTYVWDQKTFNPITHEGLFSIHFKFPNGQVLRDAFIYDWRVWSIPEIREAMLEAGFKDTRVYWENEEEEYVPSEKGTNDWSWITYVVGMR